MAVLWPHRQTADFGSFYGTFQQICYEIKWGAQKLPTIGCFNGNKIKLL